MSLINIDAIKRLMQSPSYTKPTTVPKNMPATPNTGVVGALAGVPVPNMSLSQPTTPGVTVPNMNRQPLPTGLPGSTTPVPNMNLSSANPASNVTIPNGYSASNPGGGYQPSPTGGVTLPRTEQTLNSQAGLVNTPWQYNAADDQSLQAAIRDADNKLAINQKNTNAYLRSNGQGKSSWSETVANQLANQSAENIANTLVPQYESMAYQKNQDQIGNLRNLYQDYNQQDFQNPITESSTTGVYQNAATKDALFKIMMYKAEAEGPNITAARRAELSKLADQQRAIIDANGGDSSKVGANVNSKNINQSGIGVRTLAAQNQTFNQNLSTRQQDFNEGITMADLTGSINGKPTTTEQQRQLTNLWTVAEQTGTIPDTLADQYGIPRGTQTQSAKQLAAQIANDVRGLDISQQNANTSRTSAASSIGNSQFNQAMDIWKATGAAPSGLEAYGVSPGEQWYEGAQEIKEGGLTVNQVIDNIKALYQEPIMKNGTEYDENGKLVQVDSGKTKITTDPSQRKKMFDNVVDSGLSSKDTLQALNSLGFSKEEIQKLYNEGMQSPGGQ